MGFELVMGIAIGCGISASVGVLFWWLKISVIKEAERIISKKTK